MAELFSSFTTTFFFLVALVALGIIFEKQLIALEDKFDAWVASKRSAAKQNHTSQQTKHSNSTPKKAHNSVSSKENKYQGFAA